MEDLKSRFLGIGLGALSIFGYTLNLIPTEYKTQISLFGLVVAASLVLKPSIVNIPDGFVEKRYCKHCKNLPEKQFRFKSLEKTVTIDGNGNGIINLTHEILNDGPNYIQRFPQKIGTSTTKMKETLVELEKKGNFLVKSLDDHKIIWQSIEDTEELKHLHVIFNEKLNPGETRRFCVRYILDGIYRTKKEDLPAGVHECTTFVPIHLYESYKLKLRFHPNYKYENLTYHVMTPGGDKVSNKCKDLKPLKDAEGSLVEIEEKYPYMHFEYRVDWDPIN